MARHVPTRWNLGEADLVRLTAEAKKHKGESLWRDAWRRLRRSRPSFWALVFLALFGFTSLVTPLLPLPSPSAISLRPDPSPPDWPWSPLAEPPEGSTPGTLPTDNTASLWNNGWRHRATIELAVDLEGTEIGSDPTVAPSHPALDRARAFVEELTGRTPALEVRPGEEGGPAIVHASIPLLEADEPRVDHEPFEVRNDSGEMEPAQGTLVLERRGTGRDPLKKALVYDLALPALDAKAITAWSVEQKPRRGTVFLSRFTGVGFTDGRERGTWAVDFELDERLDGVPQAVRLNGVLLPESDEAALAQPRDGARSAEVLLEEGFVHEDLGRRAQRAFEATPVAGVTYVDARFDDGYWDLAWFDRQMVSARANLFGLWQTGNWMGTDSKGRDQLSRILWGSRTSILVAFAAALTSLLIGVTYGAVSGFLGGRVDNLMMRIVDVLYSVPFIFVVIFLITVVSEMDDLAIDREYLFFIVIGAIYWLTMARVVRGQVLQLKNTEFIEAARVMGASTTRIIFTHLVPNVLSIVIVYLTLTIPAVMLFEAFLSFLGLGIEPPKVSWGLLARDGTEAITPLNYYWWLVVFPSLAMGLTLLALNVLGDGLRDALDPKLRGKS